MMRGKPDSKRIRRVFLVTSILFSLMHLVNGYGAGNTIVQLIATFIMGMFWGAIYLRTGSILITIVFHFLYDVFSNMMVLPDPIQTSNIVFLILVQLMPIVCRRMNLCINMSACERAPSSQFSQIFAWLVSASNFYVLPAYTVVTMILIIWCSRFSFFIMQKGNI